jgi:hypothetical protein
MTSDPNFRPMQPIRTDTVGSQNSQTSSPPMSPASQTSQSSRAASDFFGAISARVRGRSRSRSREASGNRSSSPMVSPPRSIPATHAQAAQPQHTRQASIPSPTTPVRPSLQAGDRRSTSGSDPWRGRHSNEWLFGGFSVTETAKGLVQRRNK